MKRFVSAVLVVVFTVATLFVVSGSAEARDTQWGGKVAHHHALKDTQWGGKHLVLTRDTQWGG